MGTNALLVIERRICLKIFCNAQFYSISTFNRSILYVGHASEDSSKLNHIANADTIGSDLNKYTVNLSGVSNTSGADPNKIKSRDCDRNKETVVRSPVEAGRLSSLRAKQKLASGRVAAQTASSVKSGDSSKGRFSSNSLPQPGNLSAANAMDYVKKITSPDGSMGTRRLKQTFESKVNCEIGRGGHNAAADNNPAIKRFPSSRTEVDYC